LSSLDLPIALSVNERTKPILQGRVSAQGLRLLPTGVHPSEIFWRQLKYKDFAASEMSMSSLLIATSQGDRTWAAIPVFTTREFYHTRILVRIDSGIETPADLKGKRVGVPEYQQTAAIWSRGILDEEFGVNARDITWHMERTPEVSHGGSTGFKPPAGVTLHRIPTSTNIGEMLINGDLDATLIYLTDKNLVDRSRVDVLSSGKVRRLFDLNTEGARYFKKTGIYPINHGLVVRRDLLEQHPWIALNLYKAFSEAKELAHAQASGYLGSYLAAGLLGPDAADGLKQDPQPYGFKAARPVLERLTEHLVRQGLTPTRVRLEDVFWPSTLDL
jgi:4,5-dihydroxyphthalate decarboxylase